MGVQHVHKLAVRDTKAAEMLGMSLSKFRYLVDEGVMPQPVRLGEYERWYRPQIECIAKGYAPLAFLFFEFGEKIDWGYLLETMEDPDGYQHRIVDPPLKPSEIRKFKMLDRNIPRPIRRAVRERDGHVCQYCGTTEGRMELDHVLPYSRGGRHTMENLVVACRTCNFDKRDKTVEEWRGHAVSIN